MNQRQAAILVRKVTKFSAFGNLTAKLELELFSRCHSGARSRDAPFSSLRDENRLNLPRPGRQAHQQCRNSARHRRGEACRRLAFPSPPR